MCTGKHMGTHTGHHPISWSSTYTSAHSSTYTVKHTDTYTKLGHMLCTHTSHKHTPTDADTYITHKHEHAHAQVIAVRIIIHTHTPGLNLCSDTLSSSVGVTKTFMGVPFLFLPQPRLQKTNRPTKAHNYHLINWPTGQTSHQSDMINKLITT